MVVKNGEQIRDTRHGHSAKRKAEQEPCLLKCLSNLEAYSMVPLITGKTPSIIVFAACFNSSFSSIAFTMVGLHL